MKGKYVAVDFDGTVVTHVYPYIGKPIPHAIRVLDKIQKAGGLIILLTMRSDKFLQQAVSYMEDNGIQLFAINNNPTQESWTNSRKVYAHHYIDDAAVGCPLIFEKDFSDRPFVDWAEVEKQLFTKN